MSDGQCPLNLRGEKGKPCLLRRLWFCLREFVSTQDIHEGGARKVMRLAKVGALDVGMQC